MLADIATPLFKKKYWFIDATASGHDIFEATDRFRDLHHEARDEELRAAGRDIGDDPVIIYCEKPECNAATHLIERFGRLSLCPNFFYVPEGYEKRDDDEESNSDQ